MDPTVYVILDRAAARGRDLSVLLSAVVAGGCRMVQLREKEWPSGRLLPVARRLRDHCRATGVTFTLSSSKLEQAKDRIDAFKREMAGLCDNEPCDEIYQFNVQLFPLTTKRRGKP